MDPNPLVRNPTLSPLAVCASCQAPTQLCCKKCNDVPLYTEAEQADTTFCSARCLTESQHQHQALCERRQMRLKLCRLSDLLRGTLFRYRGSVFDIDLTHVYKNGRDIIITKRDPPDPDQPARFPFPAGPHIDPLIVDALLTTHSLTTVKTLLGPMARKLLGDLLKGPPNQFSIDLIEMKPPEYKFATRILPSPGRNNNDCTFYHVSFSNSEPAVEEHWLLAPDGSPYGISANIINWQAEFAPYQDRHPAVHKTWESTETTDIESHLATLEILTKMSLGNTSHDATAELVTYLKQERTARQQFASMVVQYRDEQSHIGIQEEMLEGTYKEFYSTRPLILWQSSEH